MVLIEKTLHLCYNEFHNPRFLLRGKYIKENKKMTIEVKNGFYSKCGLSSEIAETLDETVETVRGTVFKILSEKEIHGFKIICLKTTIHVIYKSDAFICKNNEFSTSLQINDYMSYSLELVDEKFQIPEGLILKICDSILADLEGRVCFGTFFSEDKEKSHSLKSLFKFLCSCNFPIVAGIKNIGTNTAFRSYIRIADNPDIRYGCDKFEFAVSNINEYTIKGHGSYVDALNFFNFGSGIYENAIELYKGFASKYGGKFLFIDEQLAFRNNTLIIREMPPILSIIKSDEDILESIKDTLKLLDTQIEDWKKNEELKRKKKEEEKRQKEQEDKVKRETLIKQQECVDIYRLVLDSDGLAVNSIVSHLKGTKTNEYISHPELYGKWTHHTRKILKGFLNEMISADFFYVEERRSTYGSFEVLNIKNEVSIVEPDHKKETRCNEEHIDVEEMPNAKVMQQISSLCQEIIRGQDALKSVCAIFSSYKNENTKLMLAGIIKANNFNAGLYENVVFLELLDKIKQF